MDLKGKRLLILGGTYNLRDIKEYADSKGIVLIATGNKPDHPLCSIADEYHAADVSKAEEIIRVVEDWHIDGIFAGGNEDIISVLFDVFRKTGKPFYASKEQWDITGNKRAFKAAAMKAGLPVVPEYELSDNPSEEELAMVRYPVVVKPVDGSGSQGVYLCANSAELMSARKKALSFSRSSRIIIEQFMTGFIVVFYMTIIDGVIHIASMADKYTKPSPDGRPVMPTIAQAYLYPSRHLQDCIDNYFPSIERLLRQLGIRNGVVGIQGFCDGKSIVFTEMGYRLGGTSQQNYTKALHGNSNMFLLMNYALTGRMTDEAYHEDPFFDKTCVTLQLISKGGTIAREEGISEVEQMPEVISFEKHYSVGDTIPVVDNVSMVHYRIFIVTDTPEQAQRMIRHIQNTIRVYDRNGCSMLDEDFDVERLGLQ